MGLTVNHPFSFLADQDREPYAALTTLITDRTLDRASCFSSPRTH